MAVLVTRIRSSLLENVLTYSESWYPPLIMELDMTYLPIPFLEPTANSDEVMYARALEKCSPLQVCRCYSRVGVWEHTVAVNALGSPPRVVVRSVKKIHLELDAYRILILSVPTVLPYT